MKVKLKRIEKGFKLYEFAKMIGISRQALGKIENGNTKIPRKEVMYKISNILDTSIEDLFFDDKHL